MGFRLGLMVRRRGVISIIFGDKFRDGLALVKLEEKFRVDGCLCHRFIDINIKAKN